MAITQQISPGQVRGGGSGNTIGKAIKSGLGSARAKIASSKKSNEKSSDNISSFVDDAQMNEALSFNTSSKASDQYHLERAIQNSAKISSYKQPDRSQSPTSPSTTWEQFTSVTNPGSSGFAATASGGTSGSGFTGGSSGGSAGSSAGQYSASSGGASSGGGSSEAWASAGAGASRSESASDLTAGVTLAERQLPSGPIETFEDIPGEQTETYKSAYEKLAASIKIASFDGNVRTGQQPSMSNSITPLSAYAYSRSGGEVVDLKYMKGFSSKPEQIIAAFAEMTHGNEQLVDAVSKTGLKTAIVHDVTDCYAYYMSNASGHNGNPMMVLARSDNGLRTGTHEFTHHIDAMDGRIDGKFSIADLPDFDKNMAVSVARVRDTNNNVVGGMSLNYAETFSQRAGVKGTSKETSEYLAEFMSYYALDSNKFRQFFPELAKDFDKFLGAHGEEAAEIDTSKIKMKKRDPIV